jgi:hypothetical protein
MRTDARSGGGQGPAMAAHQVLVEQLRLAEAERPVLAAVLGQCDQQVLAAHAGAGQLRRQGGEEGGLGLGRPRTSVTLEA